MGEKEKKEFAARKKFLSQHNFKLGRDPEQYKTSYNNDFIAKSTDIKGNRAEVQQHITMLRASKINLGTGKDKFMNK